MTKISAQYVDHMGSDLTVVNAARVSFGNKKEKLSEKDEKLIKFLAKNDHMCYSDDTEVFTERGWIPFKDLDYDTKIAAVNSDGSRMSFETPKYIYSNDYEGVMYEMNSSKVSFCVTPNHRMFFQQRTSSGFKEWEVAEIQDIFSRNIRFKTTCSIEKGGSKEDFLKGCLYGFYLGDGFLSSTNIVDFRLKKIRKIKFITKILDKLNLEFKTNITNDGVTEIKVPSKYLSELDLSLKASTKRIPEKLFHRSYKFLNGMALGLLNSDGSIKSRGYLEYNFCNTSNQLLEDVSRLATLIGKFPKRGLYNMIHFTNKLLPRANDSRLSDDNSIKQTNYEGKIYCATVSTGLLLVRRNGKQLISGNSPFEHCQMTCIIDCPMPIATQILRHRTGKFNMISRRYTSKDIEFYIPDTDDFRIQSKNNKQASGDSLDLARSKTMYAAMDAHYQRCLGLYNDLLQQGLCREQARFVLPEGMMTHFYMTMDLRNWAHFLKLRLGKDSQKEVQYVAQSVKEILENLFPVSSKALLSD